MADESFTGLNIPPYYDDFSDEKNFLRILFVPSRAVQARELTQLQTIIQRQIMRFGQHIFQDGAMVLPGESLYDTSYEYLKLKDQYNSVDISVDNFEGRTILGLSSGCLAQVINQETKTDSDPNTLYIRPLSGSRSQTFRGNLTSGSPLITNLSLTNVESFFYVGARVTGSGIPANSYITAIDSTNGTIRLSANATASGTQVTCTIFSSGDFTAGEDIVAISPSGSGLTARYATVADSSPQGFGTAFTVKRGVFFTNGFFVLTDDQTIILSKYSSSVSAKVGFNVVKEIITESDDTSLNDPARGSFNFNAPGAHRYKISLELDSIDYDADGGEDFIELAKILEGRLQKIVSKSEYSELAKTFARRTYDESGNYTVRRFPIQIKEHLKTATLDGRYTESEGGDGAKFVVGMEAGKAYVLGYEIETLDTTWLELNKARTFKNINNGQIYASLGLYIDIEAVKGSFNITDYSTVQLRDEVLVFDSNNQPVSTAPGTQVGSAKVRHFSLISGTPGSLTAVYRLWLFDISMNTGKSFSGDVKSIVQASSPPAIGNVDLIGGSAVLGDPNDYIPIFPMNQTFIRTLKDSTNTGDTNYSVRRRFTGTMSGDSLTLTAASSEFFPSYSAINYHVSLRTASATAISNGFADGDVINMAAAGNSIALSGSPTGSQTVITIPDVSGSELEIVAVVGITAPPASDEKTKTLVTNETEVKTTATTIQLAKADIFRLVSVTDAATSSDVSDRFTLDNGQRDSYYDRGRLLLKSGATQPAGPLTIVYDYFTHGVGDYFSVDSYTSAIDYDDIPSFVSPTTGETFKLRDCLDFRPRINDAGNGFSVFTELPIPNESISADYSYYLPRVDKIVLDQDGNFFVLEGAPADRPIPPADVDGAMTLYVLTVPAWTYDVKKNVLIKYVENKRYTMRDIGKLEKRIENLEYYTTLSLLEKNTAELFIDDGLGNNRFKNGFVVDNFKTHLLGNTSLLAYKVAVDSENGHLRPMFIQNYADIDFVPASSSNYQKTGDLITLPYTETVHISQQYASDSENLNPYFVFDWIGKLSLDPPSDQWKDTTTLPELAVTIDNVSSIVNFLNEQARDMVFGANWNNWQTEWTGIVSSNQETRGSEGNQTFETTEVVNVGQSRSAEIPQFSLNTVTQSLGNRVVDTNLTPFMRSRDVIFEAELMKPNTRVYPFFDDVDVSAHCAPYDIDDVLVTDSNGDPVFGSALITDSTGYVKGVFRIPNSDTLRFRCGQKRFRLVDDSADRANFTTTQAVAEYYAQGLQVTEEATILSTRVPELGRETITEQRVRQEIRTTSTTVMPDPLAQSFFVIDHPNGIFLSSIDLYFRESGGTLPCFLEIRNMVNGYPGEKIVPFSKVVKYPSEISTSEDGSVATKFTFPSPVYLAADTQYCFVVGAYNTEFEIYTGRIGDFDLSGNRIVTQPYIGSLFKSQNLSTWTADQEQDIKFVMRRCVFDTSVTGVAFFNNEELESYELEFNPLTTSVDSLQGIVTVSHPNHGMMTGDEVTLSGMTDTDVNGIPASEINATHEITVTGLDTYQFFTTTSATDAGSGGGSGIKASRNMLADVFMPTISEIVLPGTRIAWEAKMASVGNSGYNISSEIFGGVVNKENIVFDEPHAILSGENEDLDLSGTKSFQIKGSMSSTSVDVSPVIDTKRAGVIVVNNRINEVLDSNGEPAGELNAAEDGDAEARWITKIFNLDEAATDLRVYFAANIPAEASVHVYYKIIEEFDTTTIFEDVDWTEMELDGAATAFVSDRFVDYEFAPPAALNAFTTFMLKIVMTSTNTAKVPLIQDFRALALGT